MNRRRSLGALGFPAFLLAWTTGVVGVMTQFPVPGADPAAGRDALPALASTLQEVVPAAVLPPPEDTAAWQNTLATLQARSEVMNGSWQPRSARAHTARPAGIRLSAVARRLEQMPRQQVRETQVGKTQVRETQAGKTQFSKTDVGKTQVGKSQVGKSQVGKTQISKTQVARTPVRPSRALGNDKAAARRDLAAGRAFDAYQRLRPQVAEARGDTEFLGLLALAALHTGQHGEAMVVYERLAAIEPDAGRWRAGLALAQESLGLDAGGTYRRALALSGESGALGRALSARLGGAS